MKFKYAMIGILVQLIATGAALAVMVDVSELETSDDITLPATYTVSEVTCGYDDFGNGVDSATVDVTGITGTTGGVFVLNFNAPVAQLSLDFSLPGVTAAVPDALNVICKNKGRGVTDMQVASSFAPTDPAHPELGGSAVGKLVYHGAPVDQIFIYFSTDAPSFSATNMSYELANSSTPGDINGDSHVDILDVLVMLQAFGASTGDAQYDSNCDLNGDGIVDVSDLLILVDNFGT